MAGIDGLGLIDMCRDVLPDLVTIVFTGHSEFAYAKTAVSLGVAEFLEKPVSVGVLEEALRKARKECILRMRSRDATEVWSEANRLVSLERIRRVLLGWEDAPSSTTDGGSLSPIGEFANGVVAVVTSPTAQTDDWPADRVVEAIEARFRPLGYSTRVFGPRLPVLDRTEVTAVIAAREAPISRGDYATAISRLSEATWRVCGGSGRCLSRVARTRGQRGQDRR